MLGLQPSTLDSKSSSASSRRTGWGGRLYVTPLEGCPLPGSLAQAEGWQVVTVSLMAILLIAAFLALAIVQVRSALR